MVLSDGGQYLPSPQALITPGQDPTRCGVIGSRPCIMPPSGIEALTTVPRAPLTASAPDRPAPPHPQASPPGFPFADGTVRD